MILYKDKIHQISLKVPNFSDPSCNECYKDMPNDEEIYELNCTDCRDLSEIYFCSVKCLIKSLEMDARITLDDDIIQSVRDIIYYFNDEDDTK